jgi:hypothetical protein
MSLGHIQPESGVPIQLVLTALSTLLIEVKIHSFIFPLVPLPAFSIMVGIKPFLRRRLFL